MWKEIGSMRPGAGAFVGASVARPLPACICNEIAVMRSIRASVTVDCNVIMPNHTGSGRTGPYDGGNDFCSYSICKGG